MLVYQDLNSGPPTCKASALPRSHLVTYFQAVISCYNALYRITNSMIEGIQGFVLKTVWVTFVCVCVCVCVCVRTGYVCVYVCVHVCRVSVCVSVCVGDDCICMRRLPVDKVYNWWRKRMPPPLPPNNNPFINSQWKKVKKALPDKNKKLNHWGELNLYLPHDIPAR